MKALATMEPEPTEHNSLGRPQISKHKSAPVLVIAAVRQTTRSAWLVISPQILSKIWLLHCLSQRLHRTRSGGVFSPSNSGLSARNKQVCFAPTVWPDTCCTKHMIRSALDKTYLTELLRNMPPLWDQRDKNYHNWDLQPKLWEETGEKLNVTGKYWNNNNELQ
jgi:hypothetical protein